MKLRLTAFCIVLLMGLSTAMGQTIKGVVIDSVSKAPVPFAAVMLKRDGWGKLTDDNGRFELKWGGHADSLVVSAMGFTTRTVPITSANQNITVRLKSDGVQLKEVVVHAGKHKYSKKNNPAVDFVNRIRSQADQTDPHRNDYYNYDKYERISIALNNINPESDKNLFLKEFGVLREYIDTSEVSGHPILNVSVREKASTVHYRNNPRNQTEMINGLRREGIDDFLDEENMRVLYEDFFSDIDLYQPDVYLLHNKFVSPLSKIAPDFYKFYLTDTLDVDGEQCIELSFIPHNTQTFGFVGKVYVPVADSTMFIKKVEMSVPRDINLNFIEKIYINQEFEKAPDGSRLLKSDDLIAEISVVSGTQGLYFRRNTAYSNHNFDKVDADYVYDYPGESIVNGGAYNRDDNYWQSMRTSPISHKEKQVGEMATALRRVPLYYWGEKILKIFVNGYINTGNPSLFDIGPVNTVVSHNSLEGFRFRAGGMSTANLSKHFFFRGYGAYGLKDHKWKYNGEVEYSFNEKRYHSREFPVHAIRLSQKYDIDMLGQHYAFTNPDNMFLSLQRDDDFQITYLRNSKMEYILELVNHFSVTAAVESRRQEATRYIGFVDGYGTDYGHYTETGISLQLRYAPGERVYQMKTDRASISPEKPVFMLTHTYAPAHFAGNMFEVNKTELSVSKRFWLSAFGYVDGIVKGGHVWSRCSYPDLMIPNANLSYTIQPESFALMNAMEFVNDSYAMWDVTYWANGTIFNYIPYLKKLKLREVFAFRGIWGHLSHRNDPERNPQLFRFPELANVQRMSNTPYMEASVGVDNIFRILRVDYVWRLTYRNLPNIDRGGVRIALHFTF